MVDGKSSLEDIDEHILQKLSVKGVTTPKAIAEDRLRENVVRIRCWRLTQMQLIEEVTHSVYTLSEDGEEFLSEDSDLSDRELSYPSPDEAHITDFSEMDPEDIKWRNKQYFTNTDHRYDTNQFSPQTTERRINGVRNSDIRRVMNEFPVKEPLSQQCAHWVRAIVGLHFFPDANHRTAMATLNAVLQLNGIDPISWQGKRYRSTIFKSKLIRRFVLSIRFDNLWSKDELYDLWRRFFVYSIHDIPSYDHHEPRFDHLDDLLQQVERR